VAAQSLTGTVLTSPIGGTVAVVTMTKGQTVSANSTSKTVTILGPGQYEVSTTIGLSLIDQLKVGDQAGVTVNGIATPLTGKVSMIGVLSSSSTSATTTTTTAYPITVLLDPTSTTLYQGAGASVAITVDNVANVLTVPTSAVHTTGSQHTVSVLQNGAVSTIAVQIGAVGVDRTQITAGIRSGQEVVLADLNLPMATSAAPVNRAVGRGGNAGGQGGAGGGPRRSGG